MNVRGIAWVGVKTSRFEEMNRFVTKVLGLRSFGEARDFRGFRLPNGDKFELFGPNGPDPPQWLGSSWTMSNRRDRNYSQRGLN